MINKNKNYQRTCFLIYFLVCNLLLLCCCDSFISAIVPVLLHRLLRQHRLRNVLITPYNVHRLLSYASFILFVIF